MGLFDFLTKKIGIDAGSENLRIVENDKIIFNDTSILSVDTSNGVVSGIGKSIKNTTNNKSIKPINYAISDFQAFEEYLKAAIKEGMQQTGILIPSLISYFCIPTAITEVEKRAIRDSAEHSGSKELYMINSSVASSINLNLLFEKKNYILIEFSASKFDINVFSDSLFITIGSVRLGTEKINKLIQNHILRTTKNKVEINKIENVLNQLHLLGNNKDELLKSIYIEEIAIDTIINSYITIINDEIYSVFEAIKANENYTKIITNGIYFTGGGTYYKALIEKINFGIDIHKHYSETPLLDSINGLKKVMTSPKMYSNYLIK